MSAAAEFVRTPEEPKAELFPLFKNSPLGLALCRDHGSITALNPALERILGPGLRTTEPLTFADLIHEEDHLQNQQLIADLFAGKRETFQIDSRTIGTDNRPVRWTAWRVEGANGAPDCVVAIAEDLPSITATEQRLRQAERLEAVGRLAGGVAHDFNNLLTGVLLYCDLLMTTLEPGHRARKYADEIRRAGMQATGLVRQLLAVARPTSSQPRLLSLNEIAEGMRNLLVRLIGENIELKLSLDPNLGLIKMDPTNAQQILLNLVLNARDAMPCGGAVAVETSNCNIQVLTDSSPTNPKASLPCALFVVEDNGNGMDDAARTHLFEPFFTTKGSKGNGLGLATVHDIVTTSGGLIHVESQLARGTRISVLLPLVSETVLGPCHSNSSYRAREKELHSSQEKE